MAANDLPVPETAVLESLGAAKFLSVSPRTLATLTAQGIVPSFKINRCRRYSVEALKEFVREQSQKSEG